MPYHGRLVGLGKLKRLLTQQVSGNTGGELRLAGGMDPEPAAPLAGKLEY